MSSLEWCSQDSPESQMYIRIPSLDWGGLVSPDLGWIMWWLTHAQIIEALVWSLPTLLCCDVIQTTSCFWHIGEMCQYIFLLFVLIISGLLWHAWFRMTSVPSCSHLPYHPVAKQMTHLLTNSIALPVSHWRTSTIPTREDTVADWRPRFGDATTQHLGFTVIPSKSATCCASHSPHTLPGTVAGLVAVQYLAKLLHLLKRKLSVTLIVDIDMMGCGGQLNIYRMCLLLSSSLISSTQPTKTHSRGGGITKSPSLHKEIVEFLLRGHRLLLSLMVSHVLTFLNAGETSMVERSVKSTWMTMTHIWCCFGQPVVNFF